MEWALSNEGLKVFLVEDSAEIRARLAAIVSAVEGAQLVGEAASVRKAIESIRAARPSAVILDLQLEDGSGLEVLRTLYSSAPELHVAVLTNYATDQHRRACMSSGAEYFLDKSTEFPHIREIIRRWSAPARNGAQASAIPQ